MKTDLRRRIETALRAFDGSDLRAASKGLLDCLGYRSTKSLDLDNRPDVFLAEFDRRDRTFRKDNALFERWKSVEFLFQITDDEVRGSGAQSAFDFDSGYDPGNYQSYLFFALDLEKNHYTRTQLANITREINLLFDMPAMLLIRHEGTLTFSVIDRRLHKKDQSRDVLEKVKLIKDIRYQDPHRAHIEILHDLALPTLMERHECRNFKELHEAWRKTLDTNELNKKFYRELADWYFWALDHVWFPDDVEKNEATRNATGVIRLLTRLIFCWFLKEKGLIPGGLFNKRRLADILKSLDDDESTFYRAILQNLFFATLNQRMNTGGQVNRKFASDGPFPEQKNEYGVKNLYRYQKLFAVSEDEAVDLFSDIPFLNGGLFDCLDKEDDSNKKTVIYVDGFSRKSSKTSKVPNFLFFSDYRTLDLSGAYGDKKKKKEKVRGLINLLDSYKFTITENTPIEEEIALDPELLGKVFENLLASYNPETGTTARKQTGSFYTPREIVNYMVEESLIVYLETELKKRVPRLAEMDDLQALLRDVFAYTENIHPFDEEEVAALIEAIDTCKILDPACGSGAFPMGILHKLVFILGKLDPQNERWKRKQIMKAEQIPDVSAREVAVEAIEHDFETNDLDYGRKLYLIENCIYGVDIQPIAIQIAKLRFFISLICDQRTNNNKSENRGVRPLPNLETKFVAANTLVYLDRGQGQLELTDPRLKTLEHELASVRHKHFAAQRRRDKLALQRRDADLRNEIAAVLTAGGMSGEVSQQLAAWDPYNQNTFAPFFDSEWMFGIMDGFDVVIGNPPYSRNLSKIQKKFINANFITASYQVDLYVAFLEVACRLVRKYGVIALITPNSWLKNLAMYKLRKFLLEHLSFHEIVPKISGAFTEASVENAVMIATKETNLKSIAVLSCQNGMFALSHEVEQRRFSDNDGYVFDVEATDEIRQILSKLRESEETIATLFDVNRGINPYDALTGQPQSVIKTRAYHANYKKDESFVPELKGKHVQPFSYKWDGKHFISYGSWLAAPRDPRFFTGRRLIFREILANRLVCTVIEEDFKIDRSLYIALPKREDLVDTRFVLGLVTSRLFAFYLRYITNEFDQLFPKIRVAEFRAIPIKIIPREEQRELVDIVQEILQIKTCEVHDNETQKLEAEMDAIVYSLYNLTPEEIAIVEDWAT